MEDKSWEGYVDLKWERITDLSKAFRDAIASCTQGIPFRKTEYYFNENSLNNYIYSVCENDGNRAKIIKKNGQFAQAFIDKLNSDKNDMFPIIANALKGSDIPKMKELYNKIEKRIKR